MPNAKPFSKREQWEQIKKRDPKAAQFLLEIRKHFGKPAEVRFKMKNYPNWICADCGKKHGRIVIPISTYHEGICGWCKERKTVTEPRDWGWPEFHETLS